MNLAPIHYFDHWTNSLETPVFLNWTTYEQFLSISLEPDSLKSPTHLRDIVHQIKDRKENFQLH